MKTVSFALFLILPLLFFSCTPKVIPVKGNYPSAPMVFHSDNSFEKTWDRLVDVFAQKGLAIKIIDKSSGLIISTNSEMPASSEDSKGIIKNPNAFIVVPSVKINREVHAISGSNEGIYTPKSKVVFSPVYGEWNVRVKPDGNGSTINVNITNVTYEETVPGKYGLKRTVTLNGYRSTGVFENILAGLIK